MRRRPPARHRDGLLSGREPIGMFFSLHKVISATARLPPHIIGSVHGDCRVSQPLGVNEMEPILCSILEAARALGVGRSKTYQLINEGTLETVTIGRRRLVRIQSVQSLADKRQERLNAR